MIDADIGLRNLDLVLGLEKRIVFDLVEVAEGRCQLRQALIKDKRFALPGRKALLKSDLQFEVVLVDASESPVERPKKDKGATTMVRRSGTLLKAS